MADEQKEESIINASGQGRTGYLELYKDRIRIQISESFSDETVSDDFVPLDEITDMVFHKPTNFGGKDGYIVIKFRGIERHVDFSSPHHPIFNAIKDYLLTHIKAVQ